MTTKIGNDEFCLHCMEWREYDEEGRCKICEQKIVKEVEKQQKRGYNEYKTESPTFEIDQEPEIDEI